MIHNIVFFQDNLDPINEELEDNVSQLNHRWSNNRRSQLLKQHQGELNRVVFSDSRRRPLSCTPPSTSISTSVSIDEDEPPNQMSHQELALPQINVQKEQSEEFVQPENHEIIDEMSEEQEILGQMPEEQEIIGQMTEEHRIIGEMRPKALSSPDFMKSYQPAFDAERDWPLIEDEVDHETLIENGEENGNSIRRRKRLDTDRT